MAETIQEIESFLSSEEFSIRITAIGQKHSLRIDQIGLLGDLVRKTLIGRQPIQAFIENLIDILEFDTDKAIEVTQDINAEIIYPFREYMGDEAYTIQNIESEDRTDDSLNKEAILSGIEDPIPHQTNKITASTVSAPVVVVTKEEVIKTESPLPQKVNDPVQSIIEKKLSQTVSTPSEHTVVEENKKPKIDPYREPIA